ncbi:GtrA family protein [Arthrobacter glacialis]|uniref:Polysaccharide synthesis protein GtrA n=1 Tax=Arthrobacter glacialis TaxID=1664 RepID=A0A2S4A142_ARTGL|nr:GtrA family protein [Arthrobacter glacialis]POH60734.1 polysaccharide synthesis protein GtrA [Arthrobacter glacialis]POH74837.1 polysaccharide synthesis protein GtrA [Arthrobacter glacialis]
MYKSLTERIKGLMGLFWREVAKFGVVGGVAFVIDTGIYLWLLAGSMGGHPTKAKIISAAVATVFSWLANRYWTFRHRRQANMVREVILFIIMNGIGLGIAAACVYISHWVLGFESATADIIAGSVVGLILGTIFRFFAYRYWVFTEELDQEPGFDHDHELIESDHKR